MEPEDDFDIIANATGESLDAFAWSPISPEFFYDVCKLLSSILLIAITLAISHKCFLLKLARSAEHAFYCTVGQMLCMGITLILHNNQLWHVTFGLMAFALGFVGTFLETWNKRRFTPQKKHFRTKHGIFGLIGSLLLLGITCSGMWMQVQGLRIKYYYLNVLLGHRLCGLLGFFSMMMSQLFSFNTGFARRNWQQNIILLFKYCIIIATVTGTIYELKCFVKEVVIRIPKIVFESINIHEHEESED